MTSHGWPPILLLLSMQKLDTPIPSSLNFLDHLYSMGISHLQLHEGMQKQQPYLLSFLPPSRTTDGQPLPSRHPHLCCLLSFLTCKSAAISSLLILCSHISLKYKAPGRLLSSPSHALPFSSVFARPTQQQPLFSFPSSTLDVPSSSSIFLSLHCIKIECSRCDESVLLLHVSSHRQIPGILCIVLQ